MFAQMHPRWQELLGAQKRNLEAIAERLDQDSESVPERGLMLRVFQFPPEHYKVLIVGQDPYPTKDHATGLAFCVPPGTSPIPPTLRNIFKELRDDLGTDQVLNADISVWAERGVMLLNRSLSTRVGETGAHVDIGWEEFTEVAIRALQAVHDGKLFAILWGQRAQSLIPILTESKVLQSPHPSPLSSYRGFFGSKPFSSCNNHLQQLGLEPIDWSC